MNKKGFTLIEIIICIVLLSVVSTEIGIVTVKNNTKKASTVINDNEKLFEQALSIYLSNHQEIIDNVNNNVKGSIITLEVLKNEGLIKDDLLTEDEYKKIIFFYQIRSFYHLIVL